MKRLKQIIKKLRAKKKSSNEFEKAQARADDDGFAIQEKKIKGEK